MYIFIFIASIIVTTLGITFSEEIFRLIQLPEEVLPEASTYLNIYLIGMVAFFGFNATSAILRGIGDSRTPLYFLIVSTILNISFDLLFIVVMDFGIAGAAWATVLSQSIAFISAIVYLNRHHEVINIKVREMRFYKDIFKQALRIGLPTGMQHTFVSLGITFIMSIVNKFGTDVIAAYTVATRIDSLALLPAMNIGQALATFVGQNIGAQKTERVKSGLKATFAISSVISLFVTGIVVIFGDVFMRFFTDDPNVIEIGEKYLVIVSSFYLLFSAMFTVNGVLRGAGDTLIPMFITLFSLWLIRIPVAYFLSDRIGETGIWWAVPIAWSAGTIVSYFYYLSGKWKTKSVVKQKEHPKADS
jgi:putative MATE family efflux protein